MSRLTRTPQKKFLSGLRSRQTRTIAFAVLSLGLVACGKQAFVVSSTTATQSGPGTFEIPAKVDILLAEDDTGSIYSIYPTIAYEVRGFLNSLDSRGWDYHFATVPLTQDQNITQVAGSKYDSNYGTSWVPPYPGAQANAPGTIAPNVFRTSLSYSGFITEPSNFGNGNEPGLRTIRNALFQGSSGTGFLRPDALLVLIVIGNGTDTSGVTYCLRSDSVNGQGVLVQAEQLSPGTYGNCTRDGQTVQYAQTYSSSFNDYKNQFLSLKSFPSMVKMYSVVSNTNTNNCLGGSAYAGTRYSQMASALGGRSYDVCSQSISSVVADLSSQLQSTRMGYQLRYLFMSEEPNPATIKVTKFANGGSTGTVIPQDATNGWTYAGYVNNVYTIDWPVQMNQASGWAIELHGSAKLVGQDTATIEFKPAGVSDSVSN